ncbi:ATP-binding protein [Belliella kenyensis]|uniref:ATP-binding protein n=1 Tax=Belliella kenyensis TaxID=1472724 RepID=A0ABV8EN38_9BACT|nr:AAA family ATPase [Belliella kenyensis]MCH7402102.1 AAA family ATPase [Belliella kenyensis]MDN3601544.1 AAA family ATPase [Belliella kenyensis]
MKKIKWDQRLIGITGARGVGKTTLLLQYLSEKYQNNRNASLYVSLDHIWFSKNTLLDLADQFSKSGGIVLVLDEVHKYPNWSREIKNINDFYPELQIIFTGSSLLEILNSAADLSRRAVMYALKGLSFREFLNYDQGFDFPIVSLETIFKDHLRISEEIISEAKPLKFWNDYLSHGYYPFYKEFGDLYHQQVRSIVNLILEVELPMLRKVEVAYIPKIKQLLAIIADSVPFTPNISKLSEKIGINRTTLLTYLHFLEECGLIYGLHQNAEGVSLLQKPEKIYLNNPNLAFALGSNVDVGNVRETFFLNQLSTEHQLSLPRNSDFQIDKSWVVEVGGKNKKSNPNCDIYAIDNIEYGLDKRIPLWLFGFLY